MNNRHLAVTEETFNMIMKDCIKEFLKENPKFIGMRITQNFIIRRIADFYLKT